MAYFALHVFDQFVAAGVEELGEVLRGARDVLAALAHRIAVGVAGARLLLLRVGGGVRVDLRDRNTLLAAAYRLVGLVGACVRGLRLVLGPRALLGGLGPRGLGVRDVDFQIGRASCRERV